MFTPATLLLPVASLLAATTLAQGPCTLSTERSGRSVDHRGAPVDDLELHLVRRGGSTAAFELRGGIPDHAAVLVWVEGEVPAGTPLAGMHRGSTVSTGLVDAQGRCAVPVELADLAGRVISVRGMTAGVAADGTFTQRTTHLLVVRVEESRPSEPEVDFSLLRIELGESRLGDLLSAIQGRDGAGAFAALLNSPGDAVKAKFTGQVMVPLPPPAVPAKVGGSVTLEAVLASDEDGYTIKIAADVAAKIGVGVSAGKLGKVSLDAGLGGGVGVAFRFATPAETVRGLRALLIQLALGHRAGMVNEDNQRRLREARAALQHARAMVEQARGRFRASIAALGMTRVARLLEGAARIRQNVYDAAKRAADAAEDLFALVVAELRFLEDHKESFEFRVQSTVNGEIKFGGNVLKIVKLEAGAAAGLEKKVVLRVLLAGGEPAELHVAASWSRATKYSAGAGLDLKAGSSKSKSGGEQWFLQGEVGVGGTVQGKFELEVLQVYDLHAGSLADVLLHPTELTACVSHELGIGPFQRKTSATVDLFEVAGAGLAGGDFGDLLARLGDVEITLLVQDSWVIAPAPPSLEIADTVKLVPELQWQDAGPARSIALTVPQMWERLTDVESHARNAKLLVGDIQTVIETR